MTMGPLCEVVTNPASVFANPKDLVEGNRTQVR
jgi:hypothetical protein